VAALHAARRLDHLAEEVMSRRQKLQFIRAQIHAEMQDKLTRTVLIAFSICAAIDVAFRGIH
jgi:hypothetical protein